LRASSPDIDCFSLLKDSEMMSKGILMIAMYIEHFSR
jgi:hypothetical protein